MPTLVSKSYLFTALFVFGFIVLVLIFTVVTGAHFLLNVNANKNNANNKAKNNANDNKTANDGEKQGSFSSFENVLGVSVSVCLFLCQSVSVSLCLCTSSSCY